MAGLVGAAVAAVWFSGGLARAQDATWAMNPAVVGGVADFNTAANWNPATVPGNVDLIGTATFGVSSGTNIGFSQFVTELGGFTLTAGASNYTFTVSNGTLQFTGAGIVVNGGSVAITNAFALEFSDSSTAGNATITNTNVVSAVEFFNNSTAGSATITNMGQLIFENSSTAGNATITNASEVAFLNNSTAGNARLINAAGATSIFPSARVQIMTASSAPARSRARARFFSAATSSPSAATI
jgi:hypothetical protein